MTTTKMKPVDAVVVGSGVVGSIMSMELANAGLKVLCLERGRMIDPQTDFVDAVRARRAQVRPPQRHLPEPVARDDHLPQQHEPDRAADARDGLVQAGRDGRRHRGALGRQRAALSAARFRDPHARWTERYGKSFFPEDCTAQDWGVTWDEVEPYYDQFEHIYGVHGKAGNLDGEIQRGRQSARRPALARVSESPDEAARRRARSSRRRRPSSATRRSRGRAPA